MKNIPVFEQGSSSYRVKILFFLRSTNQSVVSNLSRRNGANWNFGH
jgi:hypothetical protein